MESKKTDFCLNYPANNFRFMWSQKNQQFKPTIIRYHSSQGVPFWNQWYHMTSLLSMAYPECDSFKRGYLSVFNFQGFHTPILYHNNLYCLWQKVTHRSTRDWVFFSIHHPVVTVQQNITCQNNSLDLVCNERDYQVILWSRERTIAYMKGHPIHLWNPLALTESCVMSGLKGVMLKISSTRYMLIFSL